MQTLPVSFLRLLVVVPGALPLFDTGAGSLVMAIVGIALTILVLIGSAIVTIRLLGRRKDEQA